MCLRKIKVVSFLIVGFFIGAGIAPILIPNIGDNFVKADPGDVLLSFDSPGESPSGLTWDGEYLWVADTSDGIIYKINKSGEVVDSFHTFGGQPSGLTWDGEYFWCVDHVPDNFKIIIYKYDTFGNVVDTINPPGDGPTGLTWDGKYIWCADAFDNKIYKITTSGSVVTSFNCPFPISRSAFAAGLAWDGEYLWLANSGFIDEIGEIYRLTERGTVLTNFSTPGPGSFGLTYDGEYLWNVDNGDGSGKENKIYKLDVEENESQTDLKIVDINGGLGVSAKIINNGSGSVNNVFWSINVIPNFGLILMGEYIEGLIGELGVDEQITIALSNILGFGPVSITVQAGDESKQATGLLLGLMIINVKEV